MEADEQTESSETASLDTNEGNPESRSRHANHQSILHIDCNIILWGVTWKACQMSGVLLLTV